MPIIKDEAPGWKAINEALTSFYGEKENKHFSADRGSAQNGAEPLEGISVYKSSSEKPHWHYVTFGFSELEEKESEIANLSGYGFELTFRLLAGSKDKTPPSWPCNLLNDLAREVFQLGAPLQIGSHVDLKQPIDISSNTRLQATAVTADSELASIETVNGKLAFLQVIALTADELDLLKRWRSDKFFDTAKSRLGKLLITDLNRESICDDPCVALKIEEGIKADGKTVDSIKCPIAEWIFMQRISVTLSTKIVADLKMLLPERLQTGGDLTIHGPECSIVFRDAAESSFSIEDSVLIITLPASDARAFADQLKPVSSTHALSNLPLTIEFVD